MDRRLSRRDLRRLGGDPDRYRDDASILRRPRGRACRRRTPPGPAAAPHGQEARSRPLTAVTTLRDVRGDELGEFGGERAERAPLAGGPADGERIQGRDGDGTDRA